MPHCWQSKARQSGSGTLGVRMTADWECHHLVDVWFGQQRIEEGARV